MRTTEVSPAATSGQAEQVAEAQAQAVPATPAKGSLYASIHTLLMRVDALGDLPSGQVYIQTKAGVLEPFTTDRIPSHQLLELIEGGKVYAIWGHRFERMEEVDGDWWRMSARRADG